MKILIKNGIIVNEGKQTKGSIIINNERIEQIIYNQEDIPEVQYDEVFDIEGDFIFPGGIDAHVHFRDPGLTHKADIHTESMAAAAGGITSFMDMPNTKPQTTTLEALEDKFANAANKSVINYSFYFGATNDNSHLFKSLDKSRVCGLKLFMGASTGNMLVNQAESLAKIFNQDDFLVAVHSEDSDIIARNSEKYKEQYGENVPIENHYKIRSAEACYECSIKAVELAKKYNTRLHILHLSTAKELELFSNLPLEEKRITAEACVAHLLFNSEDYKKYEAKIKCNPSIKEESNQLALQQAVNEGFIDTIATDHAPHLIEEKQGGALKAVSGMPMIQFSLISMLQLADKGAFSIEKVVEKMAHAPAKLYHVKDRGFIKEGYYADLAIVSRKEHTITKEEIKSKCAWSPVEGEKFNWKVNQTFVNGQLVYNNGNVNSEVRGKELRF